MTKNVVIVEDEFFVANHLKKILEENNYTVLGLFHDGETLLENLPFISSAVFLLDIQLSTKITGVNIANELNKRKLPFIFITANIGDNAFESAIESVPVAYISKPFKEIDVLAGVALASKRLKSKISLESGKEKLLIDPDNVLYVKSDGVYIEVYMQDGTSHVIRKPLKTVACELTDNFKRCHKSFVVNIDKITLIKSGFIYIDDIKIPNSKSYRENFE